MELKYMIFTIITKLDREIFGNESLEETNDQITEVKKEETKTIRQRQVID